MKHCNIFHCCWIVDIFKWIHVYEKHHIVTTPHQDNSHHTGIGPDEWFYWSVVVLVGSCPRTEKHVSCNVHAVYTSPNAPWLVRTHIIRCRSQYVTSGDLARCHGSDSRQNFCCAMRISLICSSQGSNWKCREGICLNQGPVVRGVAKEMLVTPTEVMSDFYSVLW